MTTERRKNCPICGADRLEVQSGHKNYLTYVGDKAIEFPALDLTWEKCGACTQAQMAPPCTMDTESHPPAESKDMDGQQDARPGPVAMDVGSGRRSSVPRSRQYLKPGSPAVSHTKGPVTQPG
jgi:hypothetical protein